VAVSHDDALLFVADADHDAVVVIDTARRQVLRQTKVARQPERVLVAADGAVYVTSRGARTVTKLTAGAVAVEATASVGAEPVGLALSADGKRLLVANSLSSTVSVLDAVTLAPLRELQVAGRPWALAESADGRRLFVTDFIGGALRVLDLERGGERALSLAQPPSAECAFGDVPARTPAQAADVVLSPDGERAYVAHVQSRTGVDRGWNGSLRLAVAPALSTVDTRADAVLQDVDRVVPAFGERVVSRADFPPAMLSTNLDEGCREVGGGTGMDAPSSLVVDGRGEWIFVVDHNSNAVAVVSAVGRTSARFRDPARGIADVVRVGARPTGIAVAGDLRHAWVHNALDYSVSVIERRDGRLQEVAVIPFDRSPLPADVERGRRLFYSAVDPRVTEPEFGGVSCSSCHPDGRTDGLSWVLPVPGGRDLWRTEPTTRRAARNTPTLWGVTATAPYHWDGALADLPAFSRHMVSQMGGRGLASRDVDDLRAYLAVIDVPDNPKSGRLAPGLLARGEALFAERCASCHAGERLTDGRSHRSATLSAMMLDTPSLRGAFASAPYLHDGSAATLREVLTSPAPTIAAHAQRGLPPADLEALEAFVETR
jgi:YVTN family beta-propeller protein